MNLDVPLGSNYTHNKNRKEEEGMRSKTKIVVHGISRLVSIFLIFHFVCGKTKISFRLFLFFFQFVFRFSRKRIKSKPQNREWRKNFFSQKGKMCSSPIPFVFYCWIAFFANESLILSLKQWKIPKTKQCKNSES